MKITKLGHSCLLVEMPEPTNRTALFDPGVFSEVDVDSLDFLDDIIITHEHPDHCDINLIQELVAKFPQVRIKTPATLVPKLEGLSVTAEAVEGIVLFEAPHEGHPPFMYPPENIGVHYLGSLTHPGDSYHFAESRPILALPMTAPWGATDAAVGLALQLKPRYILPIHDWQWKDEVREDMYRRLETLFKEHNITFFKLQNAQPVVIDT